MNKLLRIYLPVYEMLSSRISELSRRYGFPNSLPYPVHLFIEPTNRCNLKCGICARSHDDDFKNREGDLEIETFLKISRLLKYVRLVQVTGYGEPFVSKNIDFFLRKIKEHGAYVKMITNGTLMNEQTVRTIVTEKLDDIAFSIDSLKPEVARKIRFPTDISRVVNGIHLLNHMKKEFESKCPVLLLNFVAQRENIYELPDLVDFAGQNGFIYINVDHLSYSLDGTYGKYYKNNSLANIDRDELNSLIIEAKERSNKYPNLVIQVCLDLDDIYRENKSAISPEEYYEKSGEGLKPKYCLFPWTTFYLSWDGTAKPCCYFTGQLDNANNYKDFLSLWKRGEKILELRGMIDRGEIHHHCKICVRNGFYNNWKDNLAFINRLPRKNP